jgi:hypothetical protein
MAAQEYCIRIILLWCRTPLVGVRSHVRTVPSHPRMSAGGAHVRAPPPSAHVWVR